MHEEGTTARRRHGRLRLAAALGAAALAVPGAGIVANAVAADGGSGSPASGQQAPGDPVAAPVQAQDDGTRERQAPDGRDCPEKDGSGSGGSSADTAV